jgi:tight adherence protein C
VSDAAMITAVTFALVSSLVLLMFLTLGGRKGRLDLRLEALANKDAPASLEPVRKVALDTLPRMGRALMPTDESERTKLQTRLVHAGYYGRQALPIFFGIKLVLMVGPAVVGILLGTAGLVPSMNAFLIGACCGIAGMIGPSFWLDHRKTARQRSFRRALPDALDVIVICLEGGLSLPGAIRRVSNELRTAHPLLALELAIVQREMHMGRSAGEALQHFAHRADLEELRILASVIIQSERFGASLVKALRTHADTLRSKRLQYAEEMAQRAAVKILLPTILCIFPGLFLVILGPAAVKVLGTLAALRNLK